MNNSYLKCGGYTLAIVVFVAFCTNIWAAPPSKQITHQSYYLAQEVSVPFNPETICTDGYHMASMYELLHTAGMVYNFLEGITVDDSGYGPPSAYGWVRSGLNTDINENCSLWTDTDGWSWVARPDHHEPTGWSVIISTCDSNKLWCISDADF
mgnify:CR=1 FL=1